MKTKFLRKGVVFVARQSLAGLCFQWDAVPMFRSEARPNFVCSSDKYAGDLIPETRYFLVH
jgi:hypothetical protein